MTQVLHIIKIAGSWGCIIGAAVCVILLKETAGLPLLLSVMSIAFSELPEG